MPKKEMSAAGRIALDGEQWIEIGDLDDMDMQTFADWVEAERQARVRDVFGYLAQVVTAWSWPFDPRDPESFGRLKMREYRMVSNAVTQRLQAISKN